jgi:putative oxidoreductase
MIYKFLFPTKANATNVSLLLLAARVVFSILLMMHGAQKLANFESLSASFPDPLGVGSSLSLGLAIFGELACSLACMTGFLYRLSMLPMMFTMLVAFFIIHANDPFSQVRELPFLYLVAFILLYIAGPGKYSIDYYLGKMLMSRKDK